jgi:hypothetical protein
MKSKYVCSNFRFHLFEWSKVRTLCILDVTARAGSRHSTALQIMTTSRPSRFWTDIEARDYVIRLFYKWYNQCMYVPFIWLNLQAVNNGCIYMYMHISLCEWIFMDILLSISCKYLCLFWSVFILAWGHRTLHCCTEWPPQGHRDPLGAGVIRQRWSQVRDDCEQIQWLRWPLPYCIWIFLIILLGHPL